jgi:agmatine/peptidylarginine deiminase
MSSIEIKLDGDALRDATVQAITGTLTPEVREKILKNAIEALLKPSTDSWRNNKSPIEEAFERAVVEIAHKEAVRIVAEDEGIRKRMTELLRITADKLLNMDINKMADRMADAFVTFLRKE